RPWAARNERKLLWQKILFRVPERGHGLLRRVRETTANHKLAGVFLRATCLAGRFFDLLRDLSVENGDGMDALVVAHGQFDGVLMFLGDRNGLRCVDAAHSSAARPLSAWTRARRPAPDRRRREEVSFQTENSGTEVVPFPFPKRWLRQGPGGLRQTAGPPKRRHRGVISSVKVCVATPTVCVLVDNVFSCPQLRARSSSLRTSRSILAVTVMTSLPGLSGTPESTPVRSSIVSQVGPCCRAKRGFSMSQQFMVSLPPTTHVRRST